MSTPIPPENSPICLDNVIVNFDPTTDGFLRYSTVTLTPSQTANKRIWTLKSVGLFRERTTKDKEYKVVYDFSNVNPAILDEFLVTFGRGINGTITVTNTRSTKGKVLDAATHMRFTQSEDKKIVTLFVRGLCHARRFEWSIDLYDASAITCPGHGANCIPAWYSYPPQTCNPEVKTCYSFVAYSYYYSKICGPNGTRYYVCPYPTSTGMMMT